ncbi:MAG: hypothetical protein KKB90_04300 [Actinobacteria bacterium]|nr:hypothetical protein [Actinomycetota bacterium]MCG2818643.1 hypothetical protein [Actinomycetes bacterium]MBU4218168.1 hypothetical protein [Actinomycetota bacterium]MBU4358593.1 hypothetical protein [Actinomycetota bacterium]MBU4392092.1 hypothetical protein [Actinomycetota bacterium]
MKFYNRAPNHIPLARGRRSGAGKNGGGRLAMEEVRFGRLRVIPGENGSRFPSCTSLAADPEPDNGEIDMFLNG